MTETKASRAEAPFPEDVRLLADLDALIAKLTAERDEWKSRFATMRDTLKRASQVAGVQDAKLAAAEKERDEARESRERLKASLNRAELRELAALAELDEARADVERFRASMYAVEERVLAVTAERDAAESQLALRTTQRDEYQGRAYTAESQLAALRARLDVYEDAHRGATLHRLYHDMPKPKKAEGP